MTRAKVAVLKTSTATVLDDYGKLMQGLPASFRKCAAAKPLMVWAPFASNVYHDFFWYPTVGGNRIKAFAQKEWGKLFEKY